MIEVRTKDKIFTAVAIPLLAAAAYVWLWRMDAAAKLEAQAKELSTLVEEEDYPFEMRRAQSRLADAQADLEAEKSTPMPQLEVAAAPNATLAKRESDVLAVLRESGLEIRRSELIRVAADGETADAAIALRDASPGTRSAPVALRRYTLDGTYPLVKKALETFAVRKMPVIAERLEMKSAPLARWTMEVWL